MNDSTSSTFQNKAGNQEIVSSTDIVHSIKSDVNCKCGCIPNIPSLFEMAAKRKEYLEKLKKEELEKQGR